jgi:APA family basic amino acid/polyamine antiporter
MTELRRELGLFEATVYGVGLILGAGIYAILGEAAGATGGSVVVSFLLAAVVASLTGLSYAELSARYPRSEGDYVYVRSAFDTDLVSELTVLARLAVGVISTAAVALAFSGYLSTFVSVPTAPVAIALVAVFVAVNVWGIDLSTRLNVAFTAVEVAGLLIVVWIGSGSWSEAAVTQTPNGVFGIVQASFLIFFAYLGFGSIVTLSDETEDASTTIPRAIVLAIGITTVLYVAVALSAVALVDWQTLGQSSSPLATVAAVGWGPLGERVLAVIALFSTANTVLILQLSTSRLLYGVSKTEYRAFPTIFSRVHPRRKTPHYAGVTIGLCTVPFVLLDDIGTVASLANLVLLAVFVVVNAALVKLRLGPGVEDAAGDERGFRAPLTVRGVPLTAVGGLVSCLALIGFSLLMW